MIIIQTPRDFLIELNLLSEERIEESFENLALQMNGAKEELTNFLTEDELHSNTSNISSLSAIFFTITEKLFDKCLEKIGDNPLNPAVIEIITNTSEDVDQTNLEIMKKIQNIFSRVLEITAKDSTSYQETITQLSQVITHNALLKIKKTQIDLTNAHFTLPNFPHSSTRDFSNKLFALQKTALKTLKNLENSTFANQNHEKAIDLKSSVSLIQKKANQFIETQIERNALVNQLELPKSNSQKSLKTLSENFDLSLNAFEVSLPKQETLGVPLFLTSSQRAELAIKSDAVFLSSENFFIAANDLLNKHLEILRDDIIQGKDSIMLIEQESRRIQGIIKAFTDTTLQFIDNLKSTVIPNSNLAQKAIRAKTKMMAYITLIKIKRTQITLANKNSHTPISPITIMDFAEELIALQKKAKDFLLESNTILNLNENLNRAEEMLGKTLAIKRKLHRI